MQVKALTTFVLKMIFEKNDRLQLADSYYVIMFFSKLFQPFFASPIRLDIFKTYSKSSACNTNRLIAF